MVITPTTTTDTTTITSISYAVKAPISMLVWPILAEFLSSRVEDDKDDKEEEDDHDSFIQDSGRGDESGKQKEKDEKHDNTVAKCLFCVTH
jgi:hypothetical protein